MNDAKVFFNYMSYKESSDMEKRNMEMTMITEILFFDRLVTKCT